MMCSVLKLQLLKKKQGDRSKPSPPFVFKWAWIQRDVLASESERLRKRETRCEKGEAWFAWFTKRKKKKTGRQTRRLLWVKFEGKKYILVQRRWRIWGLILFWVWAGETPDRAICPCERNQRSQAVSASEEEKRKRRGVTGELGGGREGGRTGRHCVSSSPLYSFTLVPFWPLGAMVTKEGVRNVLLLRGRHLRTEGSFVWEGWGNSINWHL